jgi:glycine/sarcosine N-methyltransferase
MSRSGGPGDPYSRTEYRRLIAWKRRIEREEPLLLSLLDGAPDRSVLDIGCGTGEHSAFFAENGARAVGIDASESMIVAACEHEAAGHGEFVLGDIRDGAALLAEHAPFGAAICLGNMLPHLLEDEDLAAYAAAVHGALLPGARLLIQILNYEGFRMRGVRSLPVNVRAGEDGEEIVFLRLMKPAPDGRMLFFPTTLSLDPDSEEPVAVKTTRRVELRSWTTDDLSRELGAAGFEVAFLGDMQGGPFLADVSHDLIVRAIRR